VLAFDKATTIGGIAMRYVPAIAVTVALMLTASAAVAAKNITHASSDTLMRRRLRPPRTWAPGRPT